MTARTQPRRARPPVKGRRVLLLLGLLAGLLAMHALAPAGAVAAGGHASPHSSHSSAASAGASMGRDIEFLCHGDDSGTGGHTQHADSVCASAALGTGPVLHAPLPDPVGPVSPADRPNGAFTAASEGGRAPPTLAELQLLRI
ncbi:hypothetical protein M2161_005227 [Streptomyces sp. SAI-133]|uniref:DUF6153 family protein n=1 Tax=unclassified Streptomyces TaxID=2593676 RepID=UPI002474CD2F|nr:MULTISPECIES: DUF6153 family protein [unclassified Streptomyces]MDH6549873.1 hypothetical protein [Streptomyces sp. SAI-041]MDH6586121.1 hypothetical protein [Streptomyces sp. SAI-133]